MGRNKSSSQNNQDIKSFTFNDIGRGTKKLRRRISELEKIDPNEVKWNSEEKKSIEHRIIETIKEVFGKASPEYQKYKYHEIWYGGHFMGGEDWEYQRNFIKGIPESIKMVEGLIKWLEEKKEDILNNSSQKKLVVFENLNLHHRIYEVCSDLYRDGYYANAVFDASKALINYVKEKSGRTDLDGANLMRTVFSRKDPILAFNDLKDQADFDEQEGMMHLFEGAVLAIRNPRGHTFLDDSSEFALEYIGLISMLANRLEGAKKLKLDS